jgi:hypothetical protein
MECYICYEKEKSNDKFCSNSICKCKGTNKIHVSCFEKLKQNYGDTCSICKTKFKNNVVITQEHEYNVYQNQSFDNYEMLQEILILEEHFGNNKKISIQEKQSCCNII